MLEYHVSTCMVIESETANIKIKTHSCTCPSQLQTLRHLADGLVDTIIRDEPIMGPPESVATLNNTCAFVIDSYGNLLLIETSSKVRIIPLGQLPNTGMTHISVSSMGKLPG